MIVVPGKGSSLLSWHMSQELGITNTVRNSVKTLMKANSNLFTVLKDCKIILHIDESVRPVAQTQRMIPFHIWKDLEDQLAADEKLGVIERPLGPTP